jgi:hypothetical protein
MERRRGPAEDPPELKPVDVDGVRTVAIITVLWALAFVVLAFFRSELDDAGRGWWIWACLAGVGLGLLGLEYCRKRRDAIARAELDEEADAGFDDAGDWADGELAALAAEDDQSDTGFERRTQEYSPDHRTPPAAPLPVDPQAPPASPHQGPPAGHHTGEHTRVYPPAGHDTGEHTGTYSPGGRPPPGHVTGDFPAVPGDVPPVTREYAPLADESRPAAGTDPTPPLHHRPPARPTRPAPPPAAPPRQPPYSEPTYAETATPAGYSPDPDRSRRHPRDEELARRYRDEQARAVAGGYEPPSYPEFLQDESARQGDPTGELRWSHEPPTASEPLAAAPAPQDPHVPPPSADPGRPSPPPRAPGFDSEFFTDEPATETGHGADFLLDDDDEPGGDYRGRRARRD